MKKRILFSHSIVWRNINEGNSLIHGGLCFFFLTLFFFRSHAQDCVPNIEWQKSLGGDTIEQAGSIISTPDGGYIVAGYTSSNNGDVTGNHGKEDYWVVKLASDNSITWQVPLGGSSEEIGHAIVQATDGGYVVAGSTRSYNGNVTDNHGLHDMWVVKMDSSGNLLWQHSLGGSANDFAYAVSPAADGGYIVAGSTSSSDGDVTGLHGNYDYWVVKLDADGNLEWQKALGGTHLDEAYSIKQTTDGGYIVAGYTASNDSDVTGNHGVTDYWIVKLDETGNLSWQKSLGGPASDMANYVQLTSDGGYIVSGSASSGSGDVSGNHGFSDYWVVKLDTAGTLVWQKALGGSNFDTGNAIEQTADGGYISIGNTRSNDDQVTGWHGGLDIWVTKQDANGTLLWQKALGGTIDEGGYSIKQTDDNGFILAGYSNSNDDDVSGNHGFEDFWVVKLTADVNPANTFYADVDGDGYGDPLNSKDTTACFPPAGYSIDSTDCDDANTEIHPGATEICNDLDDDCNGTTDDGFPLTSYYQDADSDNYGNANVIISSCAQPGGYVTDSTDCDDTNHDVNPGVIEVSNNGIDDNCNGVTDEFGVGIGEVENNPSFVISPNPATKVIILQLSELISWGQAKSTDAIISIMNVLGETVFEKTLVNTNGTLHEEISLDEKFTGGVYLVRISTGQNECSKSLLVLD